MGSSAVDVTAIAVGAAVALLITAALVFALRDGDTRRGWLVAAGLFVALTALGVVDLLRHTPRQTPLSMVALGTALPVLGTLGLLRATRRVRAWIRWILAWLTAVLLLFGGLLLGATIARWLPF